MKNIIILTTAIILNTILFTSQASAANTSAYPQDTSTAIELREDLPAYVFEYDLERLYPATYEFYKKLDTINRDKVYSYYLYNPKVKDVRHKIFEIALGKGKGKSTPSPFSLDEALADVKTDKLKTVFSTSSSHSIINRVTVGTINFNPNL